MVTKKITCVIALGLTVGLFPVKANAAVGCSNIVHIGDSLTVHSREYQKQEYKRIGYPDAIISAHGSRSVFNKMPNDRHTGLQAVVYWKKRVDVNACWVIALGTNDSPAWKYEDVGNRISAIMENLPGRRVAWVTVWKGPKNNSSAKNWNLVLQKKIAKYGGMSIIEWHKVVAKNRQILNPDKVHYGSTGSKMRAKYIAKTVVLLWERE
jgi:hypothetical protein